MGNKQNQINSSNNFRPQDWLQQSPQKLAKQQYGKYKTYRQIYTNQKIHKHQLIFQNEQQFHNYLDSFEWRNSQDNIVKALYIKQKHQTDFCSTTYMADVYIQNIPIRLSDFQDIPFPQNLYIMQAVLDGYEKLFNSLRYFPVNQSQVCVDNDGYVRVWCNSDLSKNYPSIVDRKQFYDETIMVNQIISMICQNTDHDMQPQPFLKYLAQRNKTHPKFDQARTLLHDYSIQYNSPIPRCCESILDMLNDIQSQESNNQGNGKGQRKFGLTEQPKISTSTVHKVAQYFNKQDQFNANSKQNRQQIRPCNHQQFTNTLPRQQSYIIPQRNQNSFRNQTFQQQNILQPNQQTKISQIRQYDHPQNLKQRVNISQQRNRFYSSLQKPQAIHFNSQTHNQINNNQIYGNRTSAPSTQNHHIVHRNNFAQRPISLNQFNYRGNFPQQRRVIGQGNINEISVNHTQPMSRSSSTSKINFCYNGQKYSNPINVVQIAGGNSVERGSRMGSTTKIQSQIKQNGFLSSVQNKQASQNIKIPIEKFENISNNITNSNPQTKILNKSVLSNSNEQKDKKMKASQYCYFTSNTEEQIDPEIIADLLRYEESGGV